MRRIASSFIYSTLLLVVFCNGARANLLTFEKEYIYQASEIDSKVSSRTIALEQVKRLLLEELGTYLISETEVKNYQLTKDQVSILTAGIVSTEILQEKWDGTTYYMKAIISADPDQVVKSVNDLRTDKQKTKELAETREKANNALAEIEKLKKENEILKLSIKKQEGYSEAVKELNEAEQELKFWNNAIKLNPQSVEVYLMRGRMYENLKNYQLALKDFSKMIELNPQNPDVYSIRGRVYDDLKKYQLALKDYSKAIELDPLDASAYGRNRSAGAYISRGCVYLDLKKYRLALKDFSKAIELNPQKMEAYVFRGYIYQVLKNEQKAIRDIKIAASLGYKPAQDELRQKGITW